MPKPVNNILIVHPSTNQFCYKDKGSACHSAFDNDLIVHSDSNILLYWRDIVTMPLRSISAYNLTKDQKEEVFEENR